MIGVYTVARLVHQAELSSGDHGPERKIQVFGTMQVRIEIDLPGKLCPKNMTTNALQVVPFEEPGEWLMLF